MGGVLDKLGRTDEALQAFDRALAADDTLTVAYLHKGGLFNRLARYEEASRCYEQALLKLEKNRRMIPVKIFCACGQKYAFDVQPARRPDAGAGDLSRRASATARRKPNRIIAKMLNGKTQPLPPPSVNALLNSVQASLAPHLVDALKDAVVQELAAQRRELLAAPAGRRRRTHRTRPPPRSRPDAVARTPPRLRAAHSGIGKGTGRTVEGKPRAVENEN